MTVLPQEVKLLVVSWLNSSDQTRLRLICKQLKAIVETTLPRCLIIVKFMRPVDQKRIESIPSFLALTSSLHLNFNRSQANVNDKVMALLDRIVRLTYLTISNLFNSGDPIFTLLITKLRKFPELRQLHLLRSRATDLTMPNIVSQSSFSSLTTLNIQGHDLGEEGMLAISQSAHLANLEKLVLSEKASGEDIIPYLPQILSFTGLKTLNLVANSVELAGVTVLAQNQSLGQLTHLSLSKNRIGDEGLETLAQSSRFPSLQTLELVNCGIRTDGAMSLGESSHFTNLTRLDVRLNHIFADGIASLAASVYLSKLTWLDIENNSAGPGGAQALAEASFAPNLTHLEIGFNGLKNEGITAFAQSSSLCNLTSLGCRHNGIDEAGAFAVSRTMALSQLRKLDLRDNNIGENGHIAIRDSQNLPKLLDGFHWSPAF